MKTVKTFAVALAVLATAALANEPPMNESCLESCAASVQTIGDTADTVDASNSYSKQLNPSSASNASGVDIGADQRLQQSGNTVDQSGSAQTSWSGSEASGNSLDNRNDNRSSVGNTSASSGGNTLSQGQSVDGSGNSSNDIRNTVAGEFSASDMGNSSNTNTNGQSQGFSDSGNASQRQGIADSGNAAQGQQQGIRDAGNASQQQGQETGVATDVAVDASDRSVHRVDARTLVLPIMAPTPPTLIAAGSMIQKTLSCGPLQDVERLPVVQKVRGGFLGWQWVDAPAGETMHLVPHTAADGSQQFFYEVPVTGQPNRVQLFGHQPVITHGLIGAGGAVQTGGGGGGSSMSWGQLAAGSSGSSQQMVVDIQLSLCSLGVAEYVTPAPSPVVVNRVSE